MCYIILIAYHVFYTPQNLVLYCVKNSFICISVEWDWHLIFLFAIFRFPYQYDSSFIKLFGNTPILFLDTLTKCWNYFFLGSLVIYYWTNMGLEFGPLRCIIYYLWGCSGFLCLESLLDNYVFLRICPFNLNFQVY